MFPVIHIMLWGWMHSPVDGSPEQSAPVWTNVSPLHSICCLPGYLHPHVLYTCWKWQSLIWPTICTSQQGKGQFLSHYIFTFFVNYCTISIVPLRTSDWYFSYSVKFYCVLVAIYRHQGFSKFTYYFAVCIR